MAFRLPKGWMLAASPRRNPRQPFRRTAFPRGDVDRATRTNAGPNAAAAAPGGAAGLPWWRALLDALAAPRARGAPPANARADRDEVRDSRSNRRVLPVDEEASAAARDAWRPVTDRLDRQREQLAGIDEHLRRLVELQASREDAPAVYAPPA